MTNSKKTITVSELFSEFNLWMSETDISRIYTVSKDIEICTECLPELVRQVLPENYNDTEIQECYGIHTMSIDQYLAALYVLLNNNQASHDEVHIFHVEIDREVLALYLLFESGRWSNGVYDLNFGRKWFMGNVFVHIL